MATASIAKLSLITAGAVVALGTGNVAQAASIQNIDFNTVGLGYITSYGNFDISGIQVIESPVEDFSGTGLMSGHVGTNTGGFTATIASDNPFKFIAASAFSGYLESLNFVVQGFKGETSQFKNSFVLGNDFQLDATGDNKWIDRLEFTSTGGAPGELLQNAMFNNITVQAVPEPSTGLATFFVLGTFGFGWMWKRQKQQKLHQ